MAPFCRATVVSTVVRKAGESSSGKNLPGESAVREQRSAVSPVRSDCCPLTADCWTWMAALDIRLFGPLRVLLDGAPMPRLRTRSVEWLLALLVLRHGRAVDRSWLAGTLWPESDSRQALHNLRDALFHLRKPLGSEGERIQSPARDTLTLDLEGAEADVLRFDAGLKAGDEGSLLRAVALYAGPLLEGCYEEWVASERQSREEACLAALETLADRAKERGDPAKAVRYLRRAQALDPLRDSVARRLI